MIIVDHNPCRADVTHVYFYRKIDFSKTCFLTSISTELDVTTGLSPSRPPSPNRTHFPLFYAPDDMISEGCCATNIHARATKQKLHKSTQNTFIKKLRNDSFFTYTHGP